FEKTPADGTPLIIRVDSETLDPAARLLEAELPTSQVREHESDLLAAQFRDLARVGIAPQIVHDPALPHIRPIHAGEPLVDRDDAGDIELGEGADADLLGDRAHGLRVSHPVLHEPLHPPRRPQGADPSPRAPGREFLGRDGSPKSWLRRAPWFS